MAEQFLTVAQAAKQLQIHPYTLRRYLREGKIRAVKISRHYRIAPSALREIAKKEAPKTPIFAPNRKSVPVKRSWPHLSARAARWHIYQVASKSF